jgi:chromosome partitioning protein
MEIIVVGDLKGGVAKTTTSVNKSHILATVYNKRVLLIDNDKQGNASRFYKLHSYDHPSIADVLIEKNYDTHNAIQHTQYANLDMITANMNLLTANLQISADESREQHTILKKALEQVESEYDYCIIDNAPDVNISIINSLVAANTVIVPIKIDQYSFDGLKILFEQIEDIREFNPGINFRGCLITQYVNNNVNQQGKAYLIEQTQYPVFTTHIRRTADKVDESTFTGTPIVEYSKRCGTAKDYLSFVKEYLGV